MGVRLRRVNPHDVRDAAVDFFWRMQAWALPTEDDYHRCWDWRYTSIPEVDPTIWIALDGERIVGHVACNFRFLQCNGQPVRAGVPGNFLVDPAYRNTMLGPQLAGAPIKLAQRGEIDLFVGYTNRVAHALALGLGCRELGPMRSFVDVRNWGPMLGRRMPRGGMLAPIAAASARAGRALTGRRRPRPPPGLEARELSAAEIAAVDRAGWSATKGLQWAGSSRYLVTRFLDCPIRAYRIVGIVDPRSGRVHGLVVTEGTSRLNIIQCEVDEAVLSHPQAVELAVRAAPNVELAVVPMLPTTALADGFSRAGFVMRATKHSETVLQNTSWSTHWRSGHPLESQFADIKGWRLWYGWNSH